MVTRVAIFGGGAAAISTAFWLTATPQLRARFAVSVYVPGWRLGGKCASGRNADDHQRIEEHGLHLLMGCYRHAFETIRRCYLEWAPPASSPVRTWDDAFKPHCVMTLMEPVPGGWAPYHFDFPRKYPAYPGDPLTPLGATCPAVERPAPLEPLIDSLAEFVQWILEPFQWIGGFEVDMQSALAQVRAAIESPPDPLAWPVQRAQILAMLHALRAGLEGLYDWLPASAPAPGVGMNAGCPTRCRLTLALLGVGVLIGWARDLAFGGSDAVDAIDELDLREWLQGCQTRQEIQDSAPVRALYSLAFAYRGGDATSLDNGSMAAGSTLRFALEATLAYRCAPLWKMSAGMGDVVFAPMYQVLRARNVEFHFFHRVTAMATNAAGDRLASVALERQAQLAGGNYEPLVTVLGLPCWPDRPHWGQLATPDTTFDYESEEPVPGAPAPLTLTQGVHFDAAVIAFPPESVRKAAVGLGGRDAAWDAMLANSASVATQSYQVWMNASAAALGWPLQPTVLTAYQQPVDSWADMSHLIGYETWGSSNPPASVHYFCGCLPDAQAAAAPLPLTSTDWAQQALPRLWSALSSPVPPALVHTSITRYNRGGSHRYVQTPAKSVKYRRNPAQPAFGHLYCAGDWTRTRFNGGCVEAAFESGKAVAAALCQASP